MQMLKVATPIKFPQEQKPILLVVIDTEEEFDWSRFDRTATSVTAMRHIHRVQRIFDEYNIKPTYVVDYPVATQSESIEPLKEIQDSGRGLIGAHLHPWVNPPHEEAVCERNSYPGNLPRHLEEGKIKTLTAAIESSFGQQPTVYKAGRYGVGPNTASILEAGGYAVDVSVCPPFDYRGQEGPDFSRFPAAPYWFGEQQRLLEIPLTGAFVGWLRRVGHLLHGLVNQPALKGLRIPGILSRLGALDRLRLSPEGCSPQEHIALTKALLQAGVRTFTWTFHSPSVVPGHTPYIQSDQDASRFHDAFRRYFDDFFGTLGGITMTPLALKRHVEEMGL